MKQLSIALNVVLFIGLLTLGYFFFKEREKESVTENYELKPDSALAKMDTAKKDLVIYYVNTDSIWDNFQMVKDLKDELAGEKIKYEGQYTHELKKLEKEYIDFQEKAPTFSMEEGKQKEEELLAKQDKLVKMEESLSQRYMESEQKKNEKIKASIDSFLTEYSNVNGFDMILSYGMGGVLLYADNSYNLTAPVLNGLNEYYAHIKSKKTAAKAVAKK